MAQFDWLEKNKTLQHIEKGIVQTIDILALNFHSTMSLEDSLGLYNCAIWYQFNNQTFFLVPFGLRDHIFELLLCYKKNRTLITY